MGDRYYRMDAVSIQDTTNKDPYMGIDQTVALLNRQEEQLATRDTEIGRLNELHNDQLLKRDTEIERLRDYVRGFLWLLDKTVLLRNVQADGSGDYAVRSFRLVMWLQKVAEASDYQDVVDENESPASEVPER